MAGVNTPTRVSYGALAAAAGGLLLIVSLFLDWHGTGDFGVNGWQSFSFVDIVLFVVGLLAIAFAVIEITRAAVRLPFDRARALTILGIVATSIVWAFIFEGGDLKIGIWLAGLSALAILAGGILAERAPQMALQVGGGGAGAGPGPGGGFGQQPGGFAPPPGPAGGYGQPQMQPPPTQQPETQQIQPPGGSFAPPPVAEQPPRVAQEPPPQPVPPPQPARPVAPPPPPEGVADWYSDPHGEKRLRYWDGTQWTHHVAD